MSAYIVDHSTIHAIITAARNLRFSVSNLDGSPGWVAFNDLDPSEVGQPSGAHPRQEDEMLTVRQSRDHDGARASPGWHRGLSRPLSRLMRFAGGVPSPQSAIITRYEQDRETGVCVMGSSNGSKRTTADVSQEIVARMRGKTKYAFQGSVEFEFTVEVEGRKAVQKARLNYNQTPEGKYFDPKKQVIVDGLYGATWSAEMRDEDGNWIDVPYDIFANTKRVAEDEVETGVLDDYLN